MNKKNILSICICTYNRSSYLDQLLESLCYQIYLINQGTFGYVNICISDNCSPDQTENVVKKWQTIYNFIAYKKNQANLGFAKNLEEACKMSEAEFVWLMGDDDLILPQGVQTVVENLVTHNQDGDLILATLGRAVLDHDNGWVIHGEPNIPTKVYSPKNPIFQDLNYGYLGVISLLILKRKFALGKAWSQRRNWAVYPHLRGVIEAASQGKHIHIGRTIVLYRYIPNNSNWAGISVLTQGIEFPELNALAISLGIHPSHMKRQYQKKYAVYAYCKMMLFLDNWIEKEENSQKALAEIKADNLWTQLILVFILFVRKNYFLKKSLCNFFSYVKPNITQEIYAIKQIISEK